MAAPVAKPLACSISASVTRPGSRLVAELDGAVPAGQQRREQRGHRGLGPGRVRDGLLEDDRVLGEARPARAWCRARSRRASCGRRAACPRGRRSTSGASSSGTVMRGRRPRRPGARPRRFSKPRVSRTSSRPRPACGARSTSAGTQLRCAGRDRGSRSCVQTVSSRPSCTHLDHELDARLVVALGGDAAGEARRAPLRDVDARSVAAGRRGGQGGADDVVDADALAGLALDPGGVPAAHVRRRGPRGAGVQEVERPGRGGAAGSAAGRPAPDRPRRVLRSTGLLAPRAAAAQRPSSSMRERSEAISRARVLRPIQPLAHPPQQRVGRERLLDEVGARLEHAVAGDGLRRCSPDM